MVVNNNWKSILIVSIAVIVLTILVLIFIYRKDIFGGGPQANYETYKDGTGDNIPVPVNMSLVKTLSDNFYLSFMQPFTIDSAIVEEIAKQNAQTIESIYIYYKQQYSRSFYEDVDSIKSMPFSDADNKILQVLTTLGKNY